MNSNPVEGYYDNNAQEEWVRLERHRTEFAITKRALSEYLPPAPARILDCGGGPGRYAIHLAGLGYEVTLLDLSDANLALARQKAQEARVTLADFIHGNALDLSRFAAGSFDAVLLMGPLYHLLRDEDRQRAVREAARLLRPGGRLFGAFITLYAPLRDVIAKGYVQTIADQPELARTLLATQSGRGELGFTDAWFAYPDQVPLLMESAGLRMLALLGVEALVSGHEQHLNALDEAAFAYWMDLIYPFTRDPRTLGAADHLLYVGEK